MCLPFLLDKIMADIQHAVIPDIYLHEPKGIVSAGPGTIYVSNGAGSGGWQKADTTNIKGLFGDGGSSNLIPVSDGSNGLAFKARTGYGQMSVTNNTNSFALTAAADSSLATNTDYVLYTGTGAPLAASGIEFGVAFTTDRLTASVAGVYRLSVNAALSAFPSTSARIGMKFRVNGAGFSPRRSMCKSNAAGDDGSLSVAELMTLNAGDFVQLYLASTVTGGLVVTDLACVLELVRAI